MDEGRKLALMRLVDGEIRPGEADGLVASCRDDPAASAHVAALAADRALLRAAFPADEAGLRPLRDRVEAAFAARRRRRAFDLRRAALPVAASVLTALVVGAGSVLLVERRAEEAAARAVAAALARDRQLSAAAFAEALDRHGSGQAVTWRNPATGSSGRVTPLRTFRAADGRYCREYQEELDAPGGGGRERVTGVACREREGGWRPALERPDAA